MRRPLLAALVAALASLVAAVPAGADDPTLRLTELGQAHFPDRGYVLTLPRPQTIPPKAVRVTENGRDVADLTVVPAAALGSNEFALALVIDASESMRGEPIRKAMQAAREFAAQRQAAQQLAVVTFNAKPVVVLPFTSEAEAIDTALASTPPVAYFTRTNDALLTTIGEIKAQNIGSASIVLLSDGRELGSTASLEEAVAAARHAHVRIFSVALRSKSFDPSSLQELASATGGFYIEARSAEQLSGIFSGLGAQLANEYFVHYRSLAGPGEKVRVRVSVKGFSAPVASGYDTPALAGVSSKPYTQPLGEKVLLSTWLMIFVVLLVAVLASLALLALVHPRRSTVRTRIGAFVSLAQARQDREPRRSEQRRAQRAPAAAPTRDLDGAPTSRWARWKEDLEIAGIEMSAASIVLWTIVGTVATGTLLFLLTKWIVAAFLGLVVPIAVRIYTKFRLERKRRRFGDQLPDNLEVLASALRAGHSLVGSLSVVVADASEPSRSEFRRVIADEQLGVPLEDALAVVVRRMANRDLDQVALVARLQRETGASSAEVLERVVENVRDRQDVRRLVRTLTAQGRLSGIVLVGLPLFMLMFMVLFNRAYVTPLFTETLGRAMLITAMIMMVLGWAAIRRIIDIKV